jgi:hypothetical protein
MDGQSDRMNDTFMDGQGDRIDRWIDEQTDQGILTEREGPVRLPSMY